MLYPLRCDVCIIVFECFCVCVVFARVVMNTGSNIIFFPRMCVGGMRNLCFACVWGTFLSTSRRWRAWIFHSSSSTKSPVVCVVSAHWLPAFILLSRILPSCVLWAPGRLLLRHTGSYGRSVCQCEPSIEHWRNTSMSAETMLLQPALQEIRSFSCAKAAKLQYKNTYK